MEKFNDRWDVLANSGDYEPEAPPPPPPEQVVQNKPPGPGLPMYVLAISALLSSLFGITVSICSYAWCDKMGTLDDKYLDDMPDLARKMILQAYELKKTEDSLEEAKKAKAIVAAEKIKEAISNGDTEGYKKAAMEDAVPTLAESIQASIRLNTTTELDKLTKPYGSMGIESKSSQEYKMKAQEMLHACYTYAKLRASRKTDRETNTMLSFPSSLSIYENDFRAAHEAGPFGQLVYYDGILEEDDLQGFMTQVNIAMASSAAGIPFGDKENPWRHFFNTPKRHASTCKAGWAFSGVVFACGAGFLAFTLVKWSRA